MFGWIKGKKKKNKRSKQLFVDSHVQGTLARRVIFHFVMFIAVGAMIGLFLQFLGDPFKPLKTHIANFWEQSGPYVIALACMIPVFIKDTISLTHRMAGPIVRLRGHVRALTRGDDVAPLKFRDGDFFDDLPAMFNQMVEKLQTGDADGLDELLARAKKVVGGEDSGEHDMIETTTMSSPVQTTS